MFLTWKGRQWFEAARMGFGYCLYPTSEDHEEKYMTTFPNSPQLLKGGIVLLDPETAAVQRIISLQFNPDTLSRTLQVQTGDGEFSR